MMKARIGVTTCDKCQQPMTEGQPVMIVVEGSITESGDILTFDGSLVHHAYHRDCWDKIAAGLSNTQELEA